MAATPDSVSLLNRIPETIREIFNFTFDDQTLALLDCSLDSLPLETFQGKRAEKRHTEMFYCIILGHPEASVEALLEVARKAGIGDTALRFAAAMAKHDTLYEAVFDKMDTRQKSLVDLLSPIASFGTRAMLAATILGIRDQNHPELAELKEAGAELFECAMEAGNFSVASRMSDITGQTDQDVLAFMKARYFKPVMQAASSGDYEYLAWVFGTISDLMPNDEQSELVSGMLHQICESGHGKVALVLANQFDSLEASFEDMDALLTRFGTPESIRFSGRFELFGICHAMRIAICTNRTKNLEALLRCDALADKLIHDTQGKQFMAELAKSDAHAEVYGMLVAAGTRLEEKRSTAPSSEKHAFFKPVFSGEPLERIPSPPISGSESLDGVFF